MLLLSQGRAKSSGASFQAHPYESLSFEVFILIKPTGSNSSVASSTQQLKTTIKVGNDRYFITASGIEPPTIT